MAPSVERLGSPRTESAAIVAKRRKLQTIEPSNCHIAIPVSDQQWERRDETEQDVNLIPEANGVPPHPLGIKPLGNAFDASGPNVKDRCGVFAMLPDELLLQVLDSLSARELLNLGATCKALYAFCGADELWKGLFVENPPSEFSWFGTWRRTLLNMSPAKCPIPRVSCDNLFSDALYRPFFCAHVPFDPIIKPIPARNQIVRMPDLNPEEFTAHWADKPFILTDPVREWPVYTSWSPENFLSEYRDTNFRVEAVDWPLRGYAEYMRNTSDESPLYLFDRAFIEKMRLSGQPPLAEPSQTPFPQQDGRPTDSPEAGKDFWPPAAFGQDLFTQALGQDRPDHRWLIVGPARSGSTFHKDPNATSAWNALIRGSKYWIMFPSADSSGEPLPTPPGIFTSQDESHISSPVSIPEYLLSFHDAARWSENPRCVEGICHEGEVLHVPSGWFHLVVNLEESIAITQNFIPRAFLAKALGFLRHKPGQVSGFDRSKVSDPYRAFVEGLRRASPEVLEQGLAELDDMTRLRDGKRKTRWEGIKGIIQDEGLTGTSNGDGGEATAFSFGFGGDDIPD